MMEVGIGMSLVIILFFPILLLWIAEELFRYFKIKANAFSESEVRAAARAQAWKLRIKDPEISCDYCGGKIDTSKYKVCPQCGAPYDDNKEWLAKFNVKEEFVNEGTDSLLELREAKAREESLKVLRIIRKKIVVLTTIFFLLVGSIWAISVKENMDRLRVDEEVNEKSYEHFTEAPYKVDGDGVIFDGNMAKVTVAGFYQEKDSVEEDGDGVLTKKVKMEFIVENKSDQNIRLRIHCDSINGFSDDYAYIDSFGCYRKNKTVKVYEKIYKCPGEEISEMIFDSIDVVADDLETRESIDKPVIIRTTSSMEKAALSVSNDELIYSNEKMELYTKPYDDGYAKGYKIYAVNKCDKSFSVKAEAKSSDDGESDTYVFDRVFLPSKYILRADYRLRNDDDENESKAADDKKIQINFTFTCDEDPSCNFATGYVEFN